MENRTNSSVFVLPLSIQALQTVVLPTISSFGVLMNIFMLTVVMQKHLRETNIGIHMVVLGVFDTGILLFTGTSFVWDTIADGYSVAEDVKCRTRFLMFSWLKGYEGAIIIQLTLERLFAVKLPLKYKKYFTKTHIIRLTIVSGIVTFILNCSFSALISLKEAETTNIFVCSIDNNPYWKAYLLAVFSFINVLLPLPFLFIGSLLVIRALNKRIAPLGNLAKMAKEKSNRINTISMILITVSYSVLQVMILIPAILSIRANASLDKVQDIQDTILRRQIVLVINAINSSINLLLYCIPGSAFRAEIRRIFKGHPTESVQGVQENIPLPAVTSSSRILMPRDN